jgi:hypothetical protein
MKTFRANTLRFQHRTVCSKTKTNMKLTTIGPAFAFMLTSTFALAHTARHVSRVRTYHVYRDEPMVPSVFLHPNYGNPNGDPDGPTTLSGTGGSQYGGH